MGRNPRWKPEKEKSVRGVVDDTLQISNGPTSDIAPCTNAQCSCCNWWSDLTNRALAVGEKAVHLALTIAEGDIAKDDVIKQLNAEMSSLEEDNTAKDGTIEQLEADKSTLADERQQLAEANKELNAKKNGIHTTVPANDRKSSGRRGRPPGGTATRNKRPVKIDREETVDIQTCSKGHKLSDKISDQYHRVVKIVYIVTENVMFTVNRRWCKICKKQVSAKVPGVAKNARVSANTSAIATFLNLNGLSHGKVSVFCRDVLKNDTSRSWSYRNKISASRRLASEHRDIERKILDEPSLQCDELWWNIPGCNGAKVMVARGKDYCLVRVTESATKKEVEKMLPGYKGVVGQDSNTIWFATGNYHQMCLEHQRRLPKKELVYHGPQGDVSEFLNELYRLICKHYQYDKIEDQHTREVAARCLQREYSELFWHPYKDDKDGTIARFRKRYRREGFHLLTHLYKKWVAANSNDVERLNRIFVSVRSNGGGNRTQKGMDANSILFTIMATDWINGNSLYEHLVRSASGDG